MSRLKRWMRERDEAYFFLAGTGITPSLRSRALRRILGWFVR